MATNTHGYINTTHCTCWDVDAYNCAGIAATDLDNGVMVALTNMARDVTSLEIEGYQFDVATADDTSANVWVIDSPEVGTTLSQQLLADPREFYNAAGTGLSLKYLAPKVDCIEVINTCFANNTLPTTTQTVVTIGAGGKLVAGTTAPAAPATYFSVVGFHTITIGMVEVPSVVLRTERN